MSAAQELLTQVQLTNRRRNLFQRGDRLLIALSGGPDSVALLCILSMLKRSDSIELFAAHLNHGLSKDASRYADLCKKLCRNHQIPFYSVKKNIQKLSKQSGKSVEEVGRDQRYLFLEKIAIQTKANKIVTAHTLDDQAETILMRIFRGSGLKGLTGIPFKRALGDKEIIRPFLNTDKKTILRFLKENKIRYCRDKSNHSNFFTRNRVRLNVLPLLEKSFNPKIRQSLARLGDVVTDACIYLGEEAQKALNKSVRQKKKGKVVLKIGHLKRLKPAILSEVLLQAASLAKNDPKRLSYEHIAPLHEVLKSPEVTLEFHLPGLRVHKAKGMLEFSLVRH